jgi:hypothetical protein
MLVRNIMVCSFLLLTASCDQASPPAPTAAPVQPAADVAKPSDQLGARKAIYELQEKCAKDARDWYKHWWEDPPEEPGTHTTSSYINHYNTKQGRCFILVSSTLFRKDAKTGKVSHSDHKELVDVLENGGGGTYDMSSEFPALMLCEVNKQDCHSSGEWEALVRPYMEE